MFFTKFFYAELLYNGIRLIKIWNFEYIHFVTQREKNNEFKSSFIRKIIGQR